MAERAGAERDTVALPIIGQEFAFEHRHVYVHRAFGFAGAAFQAQIEHVVDFFIAEAGFDQAGPRSPFEAHWRGREWWPIRLASPCRTGTWCRIAFCGKLPRRCTSRSLRPRLRIRRNQTRWRGCGLDRLGRIGGCEVSGGGSTILPGFKMPSGSKVRLISRKASYSASPKILRMNGLRTRPSPCSPDSAPPNSTTRSATSSARLRTCERPPRSSC